LSETQELVTIKEASVWATNHIGKTVTPSNISYLIQYGRVKKRERGGSTFISLTELQNYYESYKGAREIDYRSKCGDNLNWDLSFDQYKESETTKHVHRLHPYKGKFIPQLVEYFLDDHIDDFKTEVFFQPGDIVLDPFSGSGTTMVQACELGIHAIGIDISAFNTMMGNCKVAKYNLPDVEDQIGRITKELKQFLKDSRILEFDECLLKELNKINSYNFNVSDYKYNLRKGLINEAEYGKEKEELFLPEYERLVTAYSIPLQQDESESFLDMWYLPHIRSEIDFVFGKIQKIQNPSTKMIISGILSRTIRSCRATTHSDLATLLEPVTTPYYCTKHKKICKPLFSILKWWETYTKDTIKRLIEFDRLRTQTHQLCITGDSRTIDIFSELAQKEKEFAALVQQQKIKGIFSSPPYVGLIDYHEQHAYAYDLFGFERNDELEIGPLSKGKSKVAKEEYIRGISEVLNNCKRFLVEDYNVFLVANDKYEMYPIIAENADMKIVNQFHRPVLNRTEKDKSAYSETIFHLKEM